MSAILFLGEYQLRNLIKNQVLFLYLDFRRPSVRAAGNLSHWVFKGSVPATLETVADRVRAGAATNEHPIVLICENGETSMTAARELEKLGYTNIFVLRGGTEELDLSGN